MRGRHYVYAETGFKGQRTKRVRAKRHGKHTIAVLGFRLLPLHGGKQARGVLCAFSKNPVRTLSLVPDDFPLHPQPVLGVAFSESIYWSMSHQVSPKPTGVPFSPLEENVARLEWLLQHFSSTTFNMIRYSLPVMAGPPHHIHLVPGAAPYSFHTPATVLRHWDAEVREQLEEDISRSVIDPAGEATDWCARMVVVAKKNGYPRCTVDFQRLNTYCKRETHNTATTFNMVSGVPVHTYKTITDAFWDITRQK